MAVTRAIGIAITISIALLVGTDKVPAAVSRFGRPVGPPAPEACSVGHPALSLQAVLGILKQRGYFAIRDLRYRPSPKVPRPAADRAPRGRYTMTASRGFGIVRWRLDVDPCSGHIRQTGDLAPTTVH